jgi:hypothetical protein
MKYREFALVSFILLTIASPGNAGLAGILSAKSQDWSFIQSVGGMKVELIDNRLLVSCDVSGRRSITTKPSTVNSGIGVRKLKCSRAGSTIRLTVVTSVIGKGMKTECGPVDLGRHPSGSYSVVYLDPDGTTHSLGTIRLP